MADDPRVEETYNPGSQSTIFGDYELLDEVTRGGMGVAYCQEAPKPSHRKALQNQPL